MIIACKICKDFLTQISDAEFMRLEDTLVPSILQKPLHHETGLKRFLPILKWLPEYDRRDLTGDFIAGLVVAIMLVPQAMAYSNLAGLPPILGFYSSIIGLILFSLFSTSRFLSIGPVAIVSILIAAGIGELAQQGSPDYVSLAITLTLLVGIIQFVLGFFQLGFIVNFISHPVILSFTSAAAVIILTSQIKNLFGLKFPYTEKVYETLWGVFQNIRDTNFYSLGIGIFGILFLVLVPKLLQRLGQTFKFSEIAVQTLAKASPLLLVILGTLFVWFFQLNQTQNVSVVGSIESGLPSFILPQFSISAIQKLLPIAFAIAFVGFMESYSVATTLGSKRGQKVDANQELMALGISNIGTNFLGGYSVTGSFSRSMVNYVAGASTQLSSIITAVLVLLTILFLMPLFYYLPQAILAAIIIVAVKDLFAVHELKHIWNYSRADGYSWIITFLSVLIFNIEIGILIGALTAITLYLWRTSQPQVVVVGRVGKTEQFRSVSRFDVNTFPHILTVRIDENLYFANTKYIEDYLFYNVMETGQVKHLILIFSGVTVIDVSALDTLENLVSEMKAKDINVYVAEIKTLLMDKIKDSEFIKSVGEENIFVSAHDAMKHLGH